MISQWSIVLLVVPSINVTYLRWKICNWIKYCRYTDLYYVRWSDNSELAWQIISSILVLGRSWSGNGRSIQLHHHLSIPTLWTLGIQGTYSNSVPRIGNQLCWLHDISHYKFFAQGDATLRRSTYFKYRR